MSQSDLRLIKRSAEYRPSAEYKDIPPKRRGIYVLYKERHEDGEQKYDVVYVGMTTSGMHGRLEDHFKNKPNLWSHFSVFEVWENIRDDEIVELEGLFRHIYRKDTRANTLNVQKRFKLADRVRVDRLAEWK